MTAPLNAHGQLPSGLTLAALRERAVLFGGNGCEVPAPDLLCLLDTLDEAREELAGVDERFRLTHNYYADNFEEIEKQHEACLRVAWDAGVEAGYDDGADMHTLAARDYDTWRSTFDHKNPGGTS